MSAIYLHPIRMKAGAPRGCIGVSTQPHNEDDSASSLIIIDPHHVALSDTEAEEMAEEICRRWNAFSTTNKPA